jgi:hypothetical protein
MNEIALLSEHGPDSAPPSERALHAARARLMTEIAAASTRPQPRWVGLLGRRGSRRARVLALTAVATVAAAAVAVVTVATLPAQSPDRPPAGVTLAAFSTPVFPLALHPLPAGLTAPSFSAEDGRFLAVYSGTHRDSDVYLNVWSRHVDQGRTRSVTVDGQPGELAESRPQGAPASVTLTWQRKPGQWVSITGNGRFATETAVRGLADAVVDRPQEGPLQVGLAPAGWKLFAFKDDTILTLKGESSDGRGSTMSVQRVDRADPDLLHNVMGAREVSPVRINGRDGQLVRAEEMWFLQAPLPDGSVFNLQAPLVLTRDQVIAIGEQVTMRR